MLDLEHLNYLSIICNIVTSLYFLMGESLNDHSQI
jgi:hypothetical protein